MLTLNSTILSYNKIKEIEEFKPMLPPDSIYITEDLNNRSFQKFLPDIYDLDKIEYNDFKYQRSSTPVFKNQSYFKKKFLNSIIMNQFDKKTPKNVYNKYNKYNKYIESFPINIYNNEKEKSIIINENDIMKDKIQYSKIFNNQINKIDNDINNNLSKKKEEYNIRNNKNIENCSKEEVIIKKNGISSPNLNKDLSGKHKRNNNNKIINNNEINKISKKKSLDKSIHSALTTYKYKNIMRKDPNKENSIIINTSIYKRNKNKNGNNKNISEISRTSLNSFLKFEESSKDQRLNNIKLNNTQKTLKEGIINNLNNSKLENNNINSIHNNSKLISNNGNENMVDSEDKFSIKCNNLNNYTFRFKKSNINNIITQEDLNHQMSDNDNIFINNDKKLKNININYSNTAMVNSSDNNGKIISKQTSLGSLPSFDKCNIDLPNLNNKELYKDEENKPKSFISNIQDNNIMNKKNNNNSLIHIKFENLKKILIKDGLFNVLTFLSCYDLMNILQTNKSFIFLINKSISNAYYHKIKKNINKYNSDFELLKCSLIYSKVRDALKIDFTINIRFIKNKYNNIKNNDKNDFLNIKIEKDMEPKCFQIIYFYNYFKSINPKTKLKTKENTKTINMYDYYTYDLYSENDNIPNVYINKEQLMLNKNISNNTDKLVFIQPILPFKINDKGIINLEIYSSSNDFVNPSSIKIISKSFDLKKYLNDLKLKGYNNLRICEYENKCFHWKYINDNRSINYFSDIINKIKKHSKLILKL